MRDRTTAREIWGDASGPDAQMKRLGLGPDRLEEFLYLLTLGRHVDQRMEVLEAQGKLPGHVHPRPGREGVHVGVACALDPKDALFLGPRDVLAHIAKGADLARVMAQFWGRADGYTRGRDADGLFGDWTGARTFAALPEPAMAHPVACGAALASQALGLDRVAMALCDQDDTSNGGWLEALAFSAAQQLPVVWVVASSPSGDVSHDMSEAPALATADRSSTSDVPRIEVDAAAVLDLYEAASGAVDRARRGEGPTLLACHALSSGAAGLALQPDDPTDPVMRFQRRMLELGLTDDARIADLERKARDEFDRGFAFAQGSPLPPAGDLTRGLWVEDGYWDQEPVREPADA